MEILFQEDDDSSYRGRTYKNASADVTIAIASNFKTAGEFLTKKYVLDQEKLYIPIPVEIFTNKDFDKAVDNVVGLINSLGKPEITLNIAGNGIYTLKDSFILTQVMADYLTYKLLKEIYTRLQPTTLITNVKTGGQSGMDEAGAKAGIKLGIPTLVLAPKGWLFRDIDNNNFANENTFKNRFK